MLCDPAGLVKSPKTPETQKYEKITKKIQNPPPRVGPQKYEKNTEKIQEWSFLGQFCIFSVFFSYFWGPTLGGGFCIFFVIFSYFWVSGVFGLFTRPAGSQDMLPPSACRTNRASARHSVPCRSLCTFSLCRYIPLVPAPMGHT